MMPRRIEIIGGGIAGLSLGAALVRAGVATTVFEAGTYPRHRVCGEFVAGLGRDEISSLQLQGIFADAVQHRTIAWLRGDRRVCIQKLDTPAPALSRFALDARLAAAFVAAGGELRTHARTGPQRVESGRVLATGRRGRAGDWVGLKMHVRGLRLDADLEMHLGRGCYVGLCGVEDGWVNVCGLFPRRHVRRGREEDFMGAALKRAGLHGLAERMRGVEIRAASQVATAGLCYDETTGEDGHLRLGDARVAIPPFTGNGMTLAFQSAAAALPPLLAWARGDCSWIRAVEEARAAMRARSGRRLRVAGKLHPWLLRPWPQRAVSFVFKTRILPAGLIARALHG